MNLIVFNICILAGWVMSTAGAMLIHVGGGLIYGGVSLVLITLKVSKMTGIYAKEES